MSNDVDRIIVLQGRVVVYCADSGQPHRICSAGRRVSSWLTSPNEHES